MRNPDIKDARWRLIEGNDEGAPTSRKQRPGNRPETSAQSVSAAIRIAWRIVLFLLLTIGPMLPALYLGYSLYVEEWLVVLATFLTLLYYIFWLTYVIRRTLLWFRNRR